MPPASFWQAVYRHLTDPDELHALAEAARRRGLLKHAAQLYHRVVLAHHPKAAPGLVRLLSPNIDPSGAGARWTAAHTALTDSDSVARLLEDLGEAVQTLAVRAATQVDPTAPRGVARLLEELRAAGQNKALQTLSARAATHTYPTNPIDVADLLEALRKTGRNEAAERLERRALNAGALWDLPEFLQPYGREPDGTLSKAWTWDELGLQDGKSAPEPYL